MRVFAGKYRERYVESGESREGKRVVGELNARGKMIAEIRDKVRVYQECMEVMGMKDDTHCEQELHTLALMHGQTSRVWQMVEEWTRLREDTVGREWVNVDVTQVRQFVEEAVAFFEEQPKSRVTGEVSQELAEM